MDRSQENIFKKLKTIYFTDTIYFSRAHCTNNCQAKDQKKIGFINSVIIDPLSFVNTRCLCTFIPILIKLLTSDKADLDLPLIFHIPCIVCEHESWSLSISNVLIRVETFYFVNTLMRVGKQCDSLFLTFRLFLKTLMYAYLK